MAKRIIGTYIILCVISWFHYLSAQSLRQEILNLAHSYIGIKETRNNSGPEIDEIIKYCGYSYEIPWCGCFVYLVYDSCGINTPKKPEYSPNWFKEITNNPRPADAVGIYFSSKRRIAHVGILDTIIGTDLIYTSGNTSDINLRDGDTVAKKRLPITKSIYFSDWIKDDVAYHIVKPGDNLYRISLTYKVSIDTIKQLNNIKENSIKVGQKLQIS